MSKKVPDLEAAYALSGAEENRALYACWAPDYDRDFAANMDYTLPQHVALYFSKFASDKNIPILLLSKSAFPPSP